MKILGLDPGLRKTGWGIIEAAGNRLTHVANGTVTTTASKTLAERLRELHEGLAAVVAEHAPETAAVEETFVSRNAASTLRLGQARGVVMLAPALAGIGVSEYAANLVKKSVVGTGHADKHQIHTMVAHLLPGSGAKGPDAADALAVAICHAHHQELEGTDARPRVVMAGAGAFAKEGAR